LDTVNAKDITKLYKKYKFHFARECLYNLCANGRNSFFIDTHKAREEVYQSAFQYLFMQNLTFSETRCAKCSEKFARKIGFAKV